MRISTSKRLAGACLLSFLMSSVAHAQQRPSAEQIDGLVAGITGLAGAAGPGATITVGAKNYSETTGALSLSDIKITGPAGSPVSGGIANITVEGLALDQGGGVALDALKVTDLSVTVEDGKAKGGFTIPAITLTAARFPLEGPKPDANGVIDYLGWARGFAWQSFVIASSSGSVSGENGRLDLKAELDEQVFGTLADGLIDKVSMFGMRASGKVPRQFSDTETDSFEMNFSPQTIEGLNFGAYTLFFTGVGDKGERPVVPMLKKAVVGPITAKFGEQFDMRFEGAESDEVLFRPMRVGYAAILAKLASGQEPDIGPNGSPEELRLWGSMMEDLPDFIEAKRVVYKPFAMTVKDPEPVDIRIGGLLIENMKTVSYGKLRLEGISVDSAEVTARLDSLEVRDLDLSGVYRELGATIRARFVPNLMSIEKNLPLLGKWEIAGVKLAKAGEGEISLKRAALDFGAYVGVIPGSIDFTIDELFASSSLFKDASPPTPADLGYDTVLISAGAKVYYDAAKSAIIVGPIYASGKDMGTLTFNAQFGGVSRMLLSMASVAAAGMNGGQSYLDGIRFDGLSLDVTDAELLNRTLQFEGKASGKALADMKAEAKDQAAIALGSGPLTKETADILTSAISAFIDNPASLRILIQAKEPLTLRELFAGGNEAAIAAKLTVEATANSQ